MTYTHGNNPPNGNSNVSEDFDCDVLIVGAGPAGASTAYYIAQTGRRVVLLDAQRFPREKVCGDFVSPGSIRELKKIGVAYLPAFADKNILNYTVIYLNGKELIAGKFPEISDLPQYGQVIPRSVLDRELVDAARNAGANVLEGLCVTDFQVDDEGVTVTAKVKEDSRLFRTRLLIGADGNNSTVARILRGSTWPADNRAIVVRGYYENMHGSPNTASLYYSEASFPGTAGFFQLTKPKPT